MASTHGLLLLVSLLLVATAAAYVTPTPSAPKSSYMPPTPVKGYVPTPKAPSPPYVPTPKAPTPPVKPYVPTPKAPTPPAKPYVPAPKAPAAPIKPYFPAPKAPAPPVKPYFPAPKAPAPPVKPYVPAPKAPVAPVKPYVPSPKAPAPPVKPYFPAPKAPAPPTPAPYYGRQPPVKKEECAPLCGKRCSLHSRQSVCLRACSTCCMRCKCVPPGTYGNKEVCGRCYTDMTTHGGQLKCP